MEIVEAREKFLAPYLEARKKREAEEKKKQMEEIKKKKRQKQNMLTKRIRERLMNIEGILLKFSPISLHLSLCLKV